jgi:uncharacterized alpha-E superfamily protein
MISRVADHCFWLGRYLERAESTARVLLVTRNLALDAELAPRQCWLPVIIVSGEEARFRARYGDRAVEEGELVLEYLTWDAENASSIVSSLRAARENARSVREVASLETWEALNELHLWLQSPSARAEWREDRHGVLRRIRQSCQMVLGVMRSTMPRDEGLHFIWLGLMLERAAQTARILDVHHHALTEAASHQVIETALWLSLLRACSGFEPFMKRSQGRVTPEAVARFLLLEPDFPRSVRHTVHAAWVRLAAIRPPAEVQLPGGRSLERLGALDQAVLGPEPLDTAALHGLLTHVVDETSAICDLIGQELLGYERATGGQAQAQ